MVELDYSKPLATLLRESTREAHNKVSIRARRLLSGELSKQDYAQYLMMLWHVYECVAPHIVLGLKWIFEQHG